uniref:Uncharacterized protein n=1 Tax=Leersia perrieri TaxID=77586 RepID=A0A0D9XC35_9ORYZ
MLDGLSAPQSSLPADLENLKKHEAELISLLAQTCEAITAKKQEIADHPKLINLKSVSGSDIEDARIMEEADQIYLRAIEAINNFLGQ